MFSRVWLRHFLTLFLPGAVLIVAGSLLYGRTEIQREVGQIESLQQIGVSSGADALRHTLRGVSADVVFLAKLPRLQQTIDDPTPTNLTALAANFATFAEATGVYDQIRWLDQTGRERLRVNFVGDRAVVVPADQLQDKDTRYYFTKTSQLPAGAIYISPFDLNVEGGRIERPYKPILRMATPLIDAANVRHGILILNYLGRGLIDLLASVAHHGGASLMLVNSDGYWLHGPKPADEWGFMFGNGDATLAQRNPPAWEAIRSADAGQIELRDGLWTWRTVDPSREIAFGIRWPGTVSSGQEPRKQVVSEAAVWKAVARLPAADLAAIRISIWERLAAIAAVLSTLLGLASGLVSCSRQQIVILNGELARRAREAEAAGEAKARFLANMSHEIRTPMNAVLGLAYLLEKARLGADELDLVRKLRVAGRALLAIINDILDFSKIEAGRLEIEQAPFRLADVLDNLAAIMATNMADRDLELIISSPPKEVELLIGDALRLQQVLTNLASNAIKFTQAGEVSVQVTIEDRRESSLTLRFSVRDTGVGISPEQQVAIFAPFAQADSSTTRRFGGTGLGLAISGSLVAAMGGELGVISEPGRGSEFWFTVPFGVPAERRDAVPAMARLHVLIADDNAMVREVLTATTGSLNWTAEAVAGGEAAVDRILSSANDQPSCDVVLLDWAMPNMDGLAAARAIRAGGGQRQTVLIIMVAAFALPKVQAVMEGEPGLVDAVVTKPVISSSLYNAVGEALRHRDGEIEPAVGDRQPIDQRLAGLRVLVVDDSDINREVARRILEAEGAVVALAGDGRAAVALLAERPTAVDAVLMDVQMPVMDGHEACRRIRADLGLDRLPIVALTAGAFRSEEDAALAAGMNGFVAKPIDVDRMIVVLQRLTGRQPQAVAKSGDLDPLTTGAAPAGAEPVLDMTAGLRVWGDEAVYRRYLHRFVEEYGETGHRIAALLAAGDRSSAAAISHKLKGVAGNLALPRVANMAAELNVRLTDADAPVVDLPAALQAAIDAALTVIAALPVPDTSSRPATYAAAPAESTGNRRATGELLGDLLRALDRDNPDATEPILAALASHLPAEQLSAIASRVEAFEFRAAETLITTMAEQLGLTIKEED
ncbi:MAG TPA: response regulator [Stellaceae bacterium]|nr:response regulator [Stellaceae bacterium]